MKNFDKNPPMKSTSLLHSWLKFFAVLLLCINSSLSFGQIAAWDLFGESSPATSTADVYNANMDASNLLTRGAGAAASAGSNSFRTVVFKTMEFQLRILIIFRLPFQHQLDIHYHFRLWMQDLLEQRHMLLHLEFPLNLHIA
ncbi:MAG: hypothetical protein IPJ26_03235 [Bacteroidetes bacterium]|nr:hypothetical protein [Bacteroidota bacterium]